MYLMTNDPSLKERFEDPVLILDTNREMDWKNINCMFDISTLGHISEENLAWFNDRTFAGVPIMHTKKETKDEHYLWLLMTEREKDHIQTHDHLLLVFTTPKFYYRCDLQLSGIRGYLNFRGEVPLLKYGEDPDDIQFLFDQKDLKPCRSKRSTEASKGAQG